MFSEHFGILIKNYPTMCLTIFRLLHNDKITPNQKNRLVPCQVELQYRLTPSRPAKCGGVGDKKNKRDQPILTDTRNTRNQGKYKKW